MYKLYWEYFRIVPQGKCNYQAWANLFSAPDVTKLRKLSLKKVSCPICLNCHFHGESGLFRVKWWSACRWVGSEAAIQFLKLIGKISISPRPVGPYKICKSSRSFNIHVFPCLVQPWSDSWGIRDESGGPNLPSSRVAPPKTSLS